MKRLNLRDDQCSSNSIRTLQEMCTSGIFFCLLGLRDFSSWGLLYYICRCLPCIEQRNSFAYIIRRERSPVSWLWHQVSSSMGGNAGRVIANCWRFIDNRRRRVSPYSAAPIFTRLSFVSHHLQPFGFSEYEHQLPLGSHTHTHTHTQGRRVQYFNDPRTKNGAIYSLLGVYHQVTLYSLCLML